MVTDSPILAASASHATWVSFSTFPPSGAPRVVWWAGMVRYRTGGQDEPLSGSEKIESGPCCALERVPCRSLSLQATESLCVRRAAGPFAVQGGTAFPNLHALRIGK